MRQTRCRIIVGKNGIIGDSNADRVIASTAVNKQRALRRCGAIHLEKIAAIIGTLQPFEAGDRVIALGQGRYNGRVIAR